MASLSLEPSFVTTSTPADHQMDFYEEEDVDQLDSDSEVGDEHDESSASSKGYNRAEGRRIPGQTLLPAARMDSIINANGIMGTLAMSKEASYLVSIATEEFIKRMAQAGQRQAVTQRRSNVNYADMSSTTQQYQEFMFLQDTIPHPMTLTDALERREMKEKELIEMDPAVNAAALMQPSTSLSTATPNHSFAPKAKAKTRALNGKEKVNGSASGIKKESKKRGRTETNGDASGSARASSRPNRGTRAAPRDEWPDVRPAEPVSHPTGGGLLSNGVSPYRYARQPQWAANQTTMRSDDFVEDPHSRRVDQYVPPPPREEHDGWNGGQFAGPAGFLQPPFARVVPNPGRTIYSQQQQP